MEHLNYSAPTMNRAQVYERTIDDAITVSVLIPPASPVAEGSLNAQEIRLQRLLRNRRLFAILAAVALAVYGLCVAYRLPWEPVAALFFSLLGIAVVFAMKVREER